MSCSHKFIEDLQLAYAKEWNPEILMVGTFNPEWPESNQANWFYGRTGNNYFWELLPQLMGEKPMLDGNKESWMEFCRRHRIAITDLIACIRTANEEEHLSIITGYSDKKIEKYFQSDDLVITPIKEILKQNPSIRQVYFTRSANQGLWKNLWEPIKEYCEAQGIHCETLLTPSPYARYQFTKDEKVKYKTLSQFILARWREKWGK